jgi:predicted permease
MPEWKQEILKRLAPLHIDPVREPAIIEELAQHLEARYEELLSSGLDNGAAYREALKELEHADAFSQELSRCDPPPRFEPATEAASPSGNLFADFARDLRYSFRSIGKAPVFSFFAVLTLALGIGANTTVFTLINTVLLNPLPVQDPGRLVAFYAKEAKSKRASDLIPLSYLNLKDYAKRNAVFSHAAGFTPPMVSTLNASSGSQRIFTQIVTGQYFETLGIQPVMGRFFAPDEGVTPGSASVAVLSYGAWKGQFGGIADIIGRRLVINSATVTVIGVAPSGFIGVDGVFGPDAWLPVGMTREILPANLQDALEQRTKPLFHGLGRLKPGVTLKQANSQLVNVAAALEREYPQANDNRTATVRSMNDELFGNSPVLLASIVLLVVVGLVLFIACSNVANLLLARAASRKHEIAVRLAIGASRARLIRQLLTESILLGVLGGAGGMAIGYAGCLFLWSLRPAEVARNLVPPRLDPIVFIGTFLVSLATGLAFGLMPAFRASKADLVTALKEDTRTAARERRAVSFGNALLVGQVAFSLVALITTTLLLRSTQQAYQIDPGFQTAHLGIFMMNPGQAGYDQSRTKNFYREVHRRAATLPGVTSVSWASNLPFWTRATRTLSVEGDQPRKASEATTAIVGTIDTDYLSTMQIPLTDGRDFTEHDREGTTPVAIVNEAAARRYWPQGNAVGRRIQLSGDTVFRQIVGVVKTTNYTTLGEPAQLAVYLPLEQNFSDSMVLYVRSSADPSGILTAVENEVRRIGPEIQVSDIRTGAKILDQVLWGPKVMLGLLSVFGLLALTLASVGLYGVIAYSVSRRGREIGMRMALGAGQPAVLRLVLGEGMALVVIGIAAGLAISLLVGRALSRVLYGISPADPISLLGASLVLVSVAFLACYLPARRASRMDPLAALREA